MEGYKLKKRSEPFVTGTYICAHDNLLGRPLHHSQSSTLEPKSTLWHYPLGKSMLLRVMHDNPLPWTAYNLSNAFGCVATSEGQIMMQSGFKLHTRGTKPRNEA
jgi:hypothetical protein